MKILLLLPVAAGVLAATNTESKDYFTPENVRAFADHLFDAGDYLAAIPEYHRFLVMADTPAPNADTIYFRIGLCYRRAKVSDRALDYFSMVRGQFPASPLARAATFQSALLLFFAGAYDSSHVLLAIPDSGIVREPPEGDWRLLKAAGYLQQRQWLPAARLLVGPEDADTLDQRLMAFVGQCRALPRKQPWLAAVLSAAVPGAGKLYCGRPFDALPSFFGIGVMTWEAYSGFDRDGLKSVQGWIFGTIGGIFYLGNIYGSAVGAGIYNEEQEAALRSRIALYVRARFD